MAGRKSKPEVNRYRYHSEKVRKAQTPKSRLWMDCQWLVAEAWNAGPEQLQRTIALIEAHINELIAARKEGAR